MNTHHALVATAFAVLTASLFAQADLTYLRSLHPQESDVRTYVERGYTNVNVVPVAESIFDNLRSKTVGGTFIDPNFGREWKFIYDGGTKILNSERNAWNSNGSLIALTVQALNAYYDFALFDGSTAAYIRTVRLNKPFTNITQVRWMPNDPNKMFYFYQNKMYTFDINTLAIAEYQTFASFTASTTDIAGGDGNDTAPNGDILIGNKGPNCFVYNIPLKKVVRISGGNRTYLDPTQSFPTIDLGLIDYACTFAGLILEQDEDGGGVVVRDLNGAFLQTLYRRTPHMDPTYFSSGGTLYPGIMVRYNQADADYYNSIGLTSTVGTAYFHGWTEGNPSQLVRFTMDEWTSDLLGSGGQHSANRFDGSTGIISSHGPALYSLTPWQPRFGECFEQAYAAGEATMPRRFAHHYIGYDATYTTSYQPEGWISPTGAFAIIKTKWGWYKVGMGPRMTKLEVDNYLAGNTNTAPTISNIANQTITEDSATGTLAFTVGDAQTSAGSLTVSGTSSNPALVPNGNIVFGGSGASRTVTVTPVANQSGTATITVTVSDGSLSASDPFTLTVNAVNDGPTINNIANQSIAQGTNTGALAFTVGDVETAAGSLTVSGTSSNTTLVPNGNIVFGGSGPSRTVTVTPVASQSGVATITVMVSDGALSASDPFTLTVTVVNTAPTISNIANQAINEDAPTGVLAFTVGDAQTSAGSLTVSGTSSNPALVPNGNIVFGGSGASRTVTVTPVANQSGTTTITVTVSDGSLSASDPFTLTVNAVNDGPTISNMADQTIAQGTSTGALAFTVGDVETAAGSLTVTGASSNTTLVPNGNIVFGGSGTSRTVTVTPVASQSGVATITVTVSDGAATAVDTFVVNVSGLALPYADNFEDGNPSPWSVVAGSWSVVTDGTLVYQQTATTGDAFSMVGGGWDDQVVQVSLKVLSFNGTNRHVSVYARYTDTNNHYYLALRSSNVIELKKKAGGVVTTLQSVAFTIATNTWYDVRLDVIGTSLTGYVNGAQVVSATDSALVSGGVAVGMFNASAVFDNVLVTETPPPAVLLHEDFEDDVADGFTTSGGTWSFVTDITRTYQQGSTAASDAWSFHSSIWTDQVVEVDVKPVSFNGTNRPVSIYARWTDSNNHYYLALRSNNTVELKKKVGGVVTTLQSAAFTVNAGTWYTLKLEVVGSLLNAYVNGSLLLSATDSSLGAGTVALGTYAASARFADLIVTDGP